MKTRCALLLSLMLGLAVAGPALAACDVTLSSILPSNQAVLKANCGSSNMTSITWTRDAGTPSAVTFGPYSFSPTLADLNFITPLTSDTHSYTASGLAGATPIPAGQAAIIIAASPAATYALHVISSANGYVNGGGINLCTSNSGACDVNGLTSSIGPTLIATPQPNYFFSGWSGGGCSLNSTCTPTLTANAITTVTASFSSSSTSTSTDVTTTSTASTTTTTASCGAGEAYGAGDQALTPVEYQLWPVPPAAGSGDFGRAVQFVANAATYPLGIIVHTVDETQPGKYKDYSVSACAHKFASELTGRCVVTGTGSAGTLVLRFGSGSVTGDDCLLTPGVTYYVNFRDNTLPRGSVNSQFWFNKRTDQ
ncbi:MAG: hypothetical protein A3H27_11370 [Acidobacteria bacterium RIFCSPLOWO2_02_FULL_59_13]|nr:MAG: hypothetical protein A3H27_11370 [Acidobacteria bacterium RIFCSPLOWO2_02_FULL_59_13]